LNVNLASPSIESASVNIASSSSVPFVASTKFRPVLQTSELIGLVLYFPSEELRTITSLLVSIPMFSVFGA